MRELSIIFVLALITLGVFFLSNYISESIGSGNQDESGFKEVTFTVYKGKFCGCCERYVAYLQENGYNVSVVNVERLEDYFERFDIPKDMESCHISSAEGYYFVGHLPLKAIQRFLEEKPDAIGLAMPGMPKGEGAVGEGVVYYISHGEVGVYGKF